MCFLDFLKDLVLSAWFFKCSWHSRVKTREKTGMTPIQKIRQSCREKNLRWLSHQAKTCLTTARRWRVKNENARRRNELIAQKSRKGNAVSFLALRLLQRVTRVRQVASLALLMSLPMFLPKNRSERLLKDTPGPFYLDLRPKKVDSFLKKYDLRRKGTTFNLVMDRRQLNLVGRILDPLGPLSQLWESSLNAKKRSIGLDPAGNWLCPSCYFLSWQCFVLCALVGRRKGLYTRKGFVRLYGPDRWSEIVCFCMVHPTYSGKV